MVQCPSAVDFVDVVMVALKPETPCPDTPRRLVKLTIGIVAHQMSPTPTFPRPDCFIHEHGHRRNVVRITPPIRRSTPGGHSWQNHVVIDTGLNEVSLGVPAHIAYTRIVRLAAASLAVNQGMSFGEIDDLRGVIDEVVGLLLHTDRTDADAYTDDSLEFTFRFSPGKFEFEASRTGTGELIVSAIDEFIDKCSTLIDGLEIRDTERWIKITKTPAGDA